MPVVTASTERASSLSPLVPSRHVGLHADEVLDRVEGGQPSAAQQKLPLQRRGRARDVRERPQSPEPTEEPSDVVEQEIWGIVGGGDFFQFASGPVQSELTGPCFTPDGKTLFLSVQHPGEESEDKENPTSNWPDGDIPRPAVVAITGFA